MKTQRSIVKPCGGISSALCPFALALHCASLICFWYSGFCHCRFISKLVSKLKDELALPMTEAEMENAFDGIDADGNGMINFAEFRNWVGKAKKALTHL